MTPESLALVNPIIDLTTLTITTASATYVARQQASEYNQVKNALVAVHLLYIALVTLEFIRNFYSTPTFMDIYTIGNTTFVLVDVLLLTSVALAIYYKPTGAGFTGIIAELANHGRQLVIFLTFCAYLGFAEATLLIFRPFSIVVLRNLVGAEVNSTSFNSVYLDILLGVLLAFILYPSSLLFLASRRTSDPGVKRALTVLPVAWIGIGLVILIFNGYFITVAKTDDSEIAYLIAASAFSASALVFRRATILTGFFVQVRPPPIQPPQVRGRPFSRELGSPLADLLGRTMLMEVDPATDYERVVRDLITEFSAEGNAAFVFTPRGSALYATMSDEPAVRFFILTDKVSYARPGTVQNELLVPRNEQSVLLNVIDKTITSNQQLRLLIVFDNVSDLILSVGLESAYKFIKQANELLNVSKTPALFLMTDSAQGTKETNVVRGLFAEHLTYGADGLKLAKPV